MNDEEERMEDELRRTLRKPVPLPDRLAERLVEAVEGRNEAASTSNRWRLGIAAAIVLAAAVGGSDRLVQHHRAVKAEAQFKTAMQITQAALQESRVDVDEQLRGAVIDVGVAKTGKAK